MKTIFTILAFFFFTVAFSDSPLTSTYFAKACGADAILQVYKENGFTDELMQFLSSKKEDPVHKIALINEIGWGNESYVMGYQAYLIGQHKGLTSSVFDALKSNSGTEKELQKRTKSLSEDELMCWAYLQALGDYFHPQYADKAATLAINRTKSKSMAHATVFALIRSQIAFDQNWCEVYRIGNEYLKVKTYTINQLSDEAVKIIMDYLELYKGDC